MLWKSLSRLLFHPAFFTVLILASVGVAAWSLLGGTELGERATFMQAMLTVALLLATWSNEIRSREQAEASRIQSAEAKRPRIAVTSRVVSKEKREHVGIEIVNLSTLPVYIDSVRLETYTAYPDQHEIDVAHRTLASAQATSVDLHVDAGELDNLFRLEPFEIEEIDTDDPEEARVFKDELIRAAFPYTGLTVLLRFGGEPSVEFSFGYDIELIHDDAGRPSQRKWFLHVKQTWPAS
jgi:hypothetical protein